MSYDSTKVLTTLAFIIVMGVSFAEEIQPGWPRAAPRQTKSTKAKPSLPSEDERVDRYMLILGIPQGSKVEFQRDACLEDLVYAKSMPFKMLQFKSEYDARRCPFIERVRLFSIPIYTLKQSQELGNDIGIGFDKLLGIVYVCNGDRTYYIKRNIALEVNSTDDSAKRQAKIFLWTHVH